MSDKPTDTEMLNWLEGRRDIMVTGAVPAWRLTWLDKGQRKDRGVRAHTLRMAIVWAMEKQRKGGA